MAAARRPPRAASRVRGAMVRAGDRGHSCGDRDDVQDSEAQDVKQQSFAAWLVALVCLGPFAVALFIYYGPLGLTWLPQLPGSRELLRDPVPLPQQWRAADSADTDAAAAHPWQLIYARVTPCEQQC